jgi:outer membrane protein assembly factor BamB
MGVANSKTRRGAIAWAAVMLVLFSGLGSVSADEDWPMWRYDANRSAASPNAVPERMQLHWKRSFAPRVQAWDDPLNLDLMTYDRVFEPIVVNGRMFLGFNDQDKLMAFDAATGETLWTFFTEGPVRLPPVGWRDRLFACSDDGYLYCLDAASGELQWKFRGGPNSQHVIGNRRLTSAWPARGGPVIRDGQVYFASSIWPFMGTFIYSLDAETGEVQWVNDSTGAQYIKQPHSAPSFAGVAPQGSLVATEDLLIVPGGRSVPAVFDRHSGALKYFEINAGGKGTGGSFVTADETHFFVHTRLKGTRAFELSSGEKTAFMPNEPVIANGFIYSAELVDDQPMIRAYPGGADDGESREAVWQLPVSGTGDLILADDHLVAVGDNLLTLIALPTPVANGEQEMTAGEIVLQVAVEEGIERLVVADRKIFAVTAAGDILAYGDAKSTSTGDSHVAQSGLAETEELSSTTGHSNASGRKSNADSVSKARERLSSLFELGQPEGYAYWFGPCSTETVAALAEQSPFEQLAIVDDDEQSIDSIRQQLDTLGKYGRITAHVGNPGEFRAPQYTAHMVFIAENAAESMFNDSQLRAAYDAVRPYGGVMVLTDPQAPDELDQQLRDLELESAHIEAHRAQLIVRRKGALPGSADWTHQYGDIANSVKSDDRRVKLPLGVLWFGGSSNMDVLPRHGHGPPEQVIGGRLFIQGMDCLSARDVYTGRVLWKRHFEDLGTYDVYFDDTYDDTPLETKYNQVHIPGANGRGTNFVVTEDRIYLVVGDTCKILDPSNGQDVGEIRLPEETSGEATEWGFLGVYEDVLIGGAGFAEYRQRHQLTFESDAELRSSKAGFGSKSFDRAASRALIGFDRHSGEQLWRVEAKHSFWHNGIVAGGGLIYGLDKNPTPIEDAMRRRGLEMPDSYRIVAFDYHTGETMWEIRDRIFGTWLGYSKEHDLLLQAGAAASDRLYAEVNEGMRVYQARDGQLKWANDSLKYSGPCILHNDLIITNANSYSESAGAFDIRTGKQKLVKSPITGNIEPWKLTRAYGCNSIIASENMLTFRSGAAGFYDLLTDSGTGNLGGFKSGCTSNLVVANGVLNAPDYTRTCSCAYQNQTSLALVHMPDIEMWSISPLAGRPEERSPINDLGINLGAPGDRREADGTLWIEYPPRAGDSIELSLKTNDDAEYFQNHSSTVEKAEKPWLFASGVRGMTDLSLRLVTGGDADVSDIDSTDSDNEQRRVTRAYDIELFLTVESGQVEPRDLGEIHVGDGWATQIQLPLSSASSGIVEFKPAGIAPGGTGFITASLKDVELNESLQLRLVPGHGELTLCGMRIRLSEPEPTEAD